MQPTVTHSPDSSTSQQRRQSPLRLSYIAAILPATIVTICAGGLKYLDVRTSHCTDYMCSFNGTFLLGIIFVLSGLPAIFLGTIYVAHKLGALWHIATPVPLAVTTMLATAVCWFALDALIQGVLFPGFDDTTRIVCAIVSVVIATAIAPQIATKLHQRKHL